MSEQNADVIFQEEQEHLTYVHGKLKQIAEDTQASLGARLDEALADKDEMTEALTLDFGNGVNLETYVEMEALHKIIDDYNLANDIDAERLATAKVLMRRPYFAKLSLVFKNGSMARDVYIGSAGISDDDRKRLVVDWRSPVAEVYYNQGSGKCSYEANGRTIECELVTRRQFDIEYDQLKSCFDTTVAIEDPLLLQSLSKQRDGKMGDITSTIQREQNLVVRHEDVPALLVNGIAGSGKTSVLLQRIAYLLYQNRETLNPKDVWLITPNPVFEAYISNVLPNMGERNPQTCTWDELMETLGLGSHACGDDSNMDNINHIKEAVSNFALDQKDFQDLQVDGERVITAEQARSAFNKYGKFPAGPHRCSLAIEDLHERLRQRIERLSKDEDTQNLVSELDDREQIRIFGHYIAPLNEEELIESTRTYLQKRYEPVAEAIENCDWVRIERIGMRILNAQNLSQPEWLYLKSALTGVTNRSARYVMIDEVQDYTAPQLAAMASYFNKANFLLLGDENQAIKPGTASFSQIHQVFQQERGSVSECLLLTSYRSSPAITKLFASLMPQDQQMNANSVQRDCQDPVFKACAPEEYETCIAEAVQKAANQPGLTAVIAPSFGQARRHAQNLGSAVTLIGRKTPLPASGVVVMDISQAKGLEFDEVIIVDADSKGFRSNDLGRHRLYTAASRATMRLSIFAEQELTPLLG